MVRLVNGCFTQNGCNGGYFFNSNIIECALNWFNLHIVLVKILRLINTST